MRLKRARAPSPNRYTVELLWADAFEEVLIAFADTPQTGLAFPRGFLRREAAYFVRVCAIEIDALEHQPWKRLPASSAATFNNPFIAE